MGSVSVFVSKKTPNNRLEKCVVFLYTLWDSAQTPRVMEENISPSLQYAFIASIQYIFGCLSHPMAETLSFSTPLRENTSGIKR